MLVDVTFLAPKAIETTADGADDLRLYLPQHLVQQGEGGTYVWIADVSDKIARRTPISTGNAAAGGLIEVRGDKLTVASRVIARGHEGLDDGDRIRVVTEESASAAALAPQKHEPMSRLPHKGN
jgi:hypothetical protein